MEGGDKGGERESWARKNAGCDLERAALQRSVLLLSHTPPLPSLSFPSPFLAPSILPPLPPLPSSVRHPARFALCCVGSAALRGTPSAWTTRGVPPPWQLLGSSARCRRV